MAESESMLNIELDDNSAEEISLKPETKQTPLLVWLALIIAVFSMSSGGIWFAVVPESPPILKASWRLGLTSVLQFPPFIHQYVQAEVGLVTCWLGHLWLMTVVGIFLATHFACWSWSVAHTSLTHSLLLVCSGPLMIVCWLGLKYIIARYGFCSTSTTTTSYIRVDDSSSHDTEHYNDKGCDAFSVQQAILRETSFSENLNIASHTEAEEMRASDDVLIPARKKQVHFSDFVEVRFFSDSNEKKPNVYPIPLSPKVWFEKAISCDNAIPPNAMEVAGALVGFLGGITLISFVAADDGDSKTSITGDLMALIGAAAVVFYLLVGGQIRKWCPVCIYYIFIFLLYYLY